MRCIDGMDRSPTTPIDSIACGGDVKLRISIDGEVWGMVLQLALIQH
jgi:hypothetical protein